jgi:hypothetical protein
MLGTRRASVTLAAGILQKAVLITITDSRGAVTIINRHRLEEAPCGCYYARLSSLESGEIKRPAGVKTFKKILGLAQKRIYFRESPQYSYNVGVKQLWQPSPLREKTILPKAQSIAPIRTANHATIFAGSKNN